MKFIRTSLGIDISDSRIALVALRSFLGRVSVAAPPLLHEFRDKREAAARLEEIEAVLGEYVARHGLVGADAFLVLPAERVHSMRVAFPSMRDKDLRDAIGLELDRLFPLPSDQLRYGYMKLPGQAKDGKVSLIVSAVSKEFIDPLDQLLSRAGLIPAGSAPSAWAAGTSVARIFGNSADRSGFSVLLRRLEESVECTVFRGAAPLFCSTRPCDEEKAGEEGISIALAALAETSVGEDGPVELYAPPEWFPEREFTRGADEVSFRVAEDFTARALGAMFGPDLSPGVADPSIFLCAYGVAAGGKDKDLQTSTSAGEMSIATRKVAVACAVAALLLGLAWPAAVALRVVADLKRMDRHVAELRPFAEQYQAAQAEVDDIKAKLLVFREMEIASGEAILILKELTDRFPNGTWVASVRLEERNVDIEGFSPSANDLFPALTRDGRFRSVNFGAPVMRQNENLERFRLRGEYVPLGTPASPEPTEPQEEEEGA
ncbi:MAG: PilN domain-containing protein [Syntrophorhabdaceae bacterium]|nr:PilN domain-containing protein [Syntrophorhabdaceae bacterium]